MQSLVGSSNSGPNAWGGAVCASVPLGGAAGSTPLFGAGVTGPGRLKKLSIKWATLGVQSTPVVYIDITIDGRTDSVLVSTFRGAASPMPDPSASPAINVFDVPLDLDFQQSMNVAVRVATPSDNPLASWCGASYMLRK